MTSRAPKRATYEDVLAAPERMTAQIVGGVLYTNPRPAGFHTRSASVLGGRLMRSFDFDDGGGPGGWILLAEPELHLDDDILVPDLAGWRRDRLPRVENTAYFTLPPDWVCEVLSPSTAGLDRTEKMSIYARAGIGHAWIVDPVLHTLEVYRLLSSETRQWILVGTHRSDAVVRAEPFDAVELPLASVWA